MDKFKQYIESHKARFETDEPSEQVWLNIQNKVIRRKRHISIQLIRYLSAACIVILCGLVLWQFYLRKVNILNKHELKTYLKTPKKIIDSKVAELIDVQPSNRKVKYKKSGHNGSALRTSSLIQVDHTDLNALNKLGGSFNKIIADQTKLINHTPLYVESPTYFKDYIELINQIHLDEVKINQEIINSGPNDQLLGQLINVYQQKLNILKGLQEEINKTNNLFLQNRIDADNRKPKFLNI